MEENSLFPTSPKKDEQPHLNPRSCVTCRKRKVKCDKVEPKCGNCVKAKIDCIYPAPGRAPRKARKPPDAELLKRLRRLEGVVQSLGAQVEDEKPVNSPDHQASSSRNPSITDNHSTESQPTEDQCPIKKRMEEAEKEANSLPLGKLVISEGKSRYVNNVYWASIGNEIADIKDILDQSESDDDEGESPESGNHVHSPHSTPGFIFGFSSLAVDMKRLYPTPSQTFIIWQIFKENIDPIIKVLHCPSVKNLIIKASVAADDMSKPTEALFFSICFGSIVSMTEDQCQSLLGDSKMNLWKKYRFATEQALARCDFLNSSDLVTLQAFVFYLICVRYFDDSKATWAMCGLAIHLAFTQGLHRDGTHFNLPPFDVEMRRRLWWHIAMLDMRATEDHGTEIRTASSSFDTKFPSNVDDADIWPNMTTPPINKKGPTEMIFCLTRFELSAMTRKLNLFTPDTCLFSEQAIKHKEKMIDECHKMIEEKYITGCDMNIPIYWVAATVSRLILAKMWLKLHHPRLAGKGLYENPELRNRVFITSVEVVEFGHLLESNTNTAKWGWLFRTYMQWHAVAYVLSELCIRPQSTETDRAWRAIEAVYEDSEHARKQRGMLWKPIRQLMIKARANQARSRQQMKPEDIDFKPDDPQWISGPSAMVGTAALAFDLDFQDAGIVENLQPNTNDMGMHFPDMNLANTLPNTTSTPDTQSTQALTPEFFNWEGWGPAGDFMNGAQTLQTFAFDPNKPQEWF